MKLSSRGWFALSIIFSLAVIIVIFATTFNQETIGYILSFNLVFLGLAILFRFLALGLWGVRIQVMAGSLGYRVRLPYCVNMVLAGLLAGTITPGQVGNDPVRVHELYRAGVPVGDATAVVIMERLLDGIILTVMGLLIMTLMTDYFLSTFSPALIILVIIAWIFMISFLFIPVLAIKYPVKTKSVILRVVNWIAPRLSRSSAPSQALSERVDHEIDNFFGTLKTFTGTARRGLLVGGIVTGLFWISEFLVASVIMMGLGLHAYVLESFFFQILIAIIMMIPLTPGSSGITEISTSSLYALIIPSGMIGIFVLLWRFVTFYLNIILGALASLSIFKRELEYKEKEKEHEKLV
ncbi:MAG: flippase-like domain-containing protein [Methanoregula sp.]|nr:flippase-like domain-containing protein [Methanoregula sp.]